MQVAYDNGYDVELASDPVRDGVHAWLGLTEAILTRHPRRGITRCVTCKRPQCLRPAWQFIAQTPSCPQVWLAKTVVDFATYKALVLGDGSVHSTTDGALFTSAVQVEVGLKSSFKHIYMITSPEQRRA